MYSLSPYFRVRRCLKHCKDWMDKCSKSNIFTLSLFQNKKERLAAKNRSNDDLNEQEKERRAAWLAIRCAASVAVAQRNRILLIGDMTVTLQRLSEKSQNEIPDFAALDLVGSYVLGDKKKVYKSR